MRALVIEDEATTRTVLVGMLEQEGFSVTATPSGREGVRHFKDSVEERNYFHLVCLDIGLPDLDGHGALREMRQAEKQFDVDLAHGAVVFMTTGARDGRNVMRSFFGGCQAYLPKPVTVDALRSKLDEHGLNSVAGMRT